jgi:acetyl esterase/lipase
MRCLFRLPAAVGVATSLVVAAQAQTAFYAVSKEELVGRPGTLIRHEPISGAPSGASAYRLLYRSTGLKGELIATSGVVVVPAGPVPSGGRPIVAWAHPTTGVAPACAPSLVPFVFATIQGLEEMVKRGYVVVATDYAGLGTAAPHPYLVGASAARSVLDSVRAARLMPGAGNGRSFVVWGHSQGGHAALYTGMLAHRYAPDLRLRGVAAAAPALDLAPLLDNAHESQIGKGLTAMMLWSWTRLFGKAIEGGIDPASVPTVDRLAGECVETTSELAVLRQTEQPLEQRFVTVTHMAEKEPWRSLVSRNTPGLLPRRLPVFLTQGTDDEVVSPAATENYMRRLCRAGRSVRMLVMPKVGHDFAAHDSASAVVDWAADRFAGRAVPSDCGK